MKNSEHSSEMPLKMPTSNQLNKFPRASLITMLIVSFVGFIDAMYLTVQHYRGSALNCTVFEGCNTVAQSEYSLFFGIPVALFGVIFYTGMFFLTVLFLDLKNKIFVYLLLLGGIVGFLFSLWFTYLQFFVIKAICEYCLLSGVNSTLLLLLSIIAFLRFKKLSQN